MADERQLSVAEWRAYAEGLRVCARDPDVTLSLEDFRALAHLELIDHVKELERALDDVERGLRRERRARP